GPGGGALLTVRLDELGEAQDLLAVALGQAARLAGQRADAGRLLERPFEKIRDGVVVEPRETLDLERLDLALAVLDGGDRHAGNAGLVGHELLRQAQVLSRLAQAVGEPSLALFAR